MKKLFAVFALFGVLMAGCITDYNNLDVGFMAGEHPLRKMNSLVSNTTSGRFFLLGGSFRSITETKLEFAWKLNKDTYILTSVWLKDVRVKIDNKATVPTINFKFFPECWRRETLLEEDAADILYRCLRYATVTVKDSDWPIQIDLPLNQPLPAEKE